MLITRFAKILISLSLALFCLLVAFDNVTDPRSNYEFVSHVMSMDTTFPDNRLMYRSVTDPLIWQITYALIIATQFVCSFLFLAGAISMWRARYAVAADFHQAKAYAIAGALLGLIVLAVALIGYEPGTLIDDAPGTTIADVVAPLEGNEELALYQDLPVLENFELLNNFEVLQELQTATQ